MPAAVELNKESSPMRKRQLGVESTIQVGDSEADSFGDDLPKVVTPVGRPLKKIKKNILRRTGIYSIF